MIGFQLQRVWAPERLRKPRRGLRAYQVGLALALLFLLHALVVNVLLLSGGLGWFLARATGVLQIDTGRSFSLWPGLVQLRQLHLEVTDSNVHLELEVPTGRANILLRELLRRRFVAEGVTGEHFVLRLRPKFEQLTERRLAALPPLAEPVSKPSSGEVPYLWPIRIQGSSAQYDELWVSELRYRGDARVVGGFELVPLQRVSVDPSDVELRGGALTYGPDQSAFEIQRAELHAELRETEVEQLPAQWRKQVSARVDLAGKVVDLGFAANLSPELEGLSDGRGELTVRAQAEQGEWVGGFDLEYAAPRVAYTNDGWSGLSELSVSAHSAADAVDPGGGKPALPATLRVHSAQVDRQGRHLAQLELCQLDLKLTRAFPFAVPHAASLNLQGLALDELERLPKAFRPGHWLPRALNLRRVRAALAWQDGVANGSAEAQFRDLSFGYRDWSFQQNGELTLAGLHWKGPGFKLRLSGVTLGLDSVRIQHPETQIDSWSLRVLLDQVAYAPIAQRLEANFIASGEDARPVLSLLGVRGLPPGASDFLAMPDLRVRGSVDLSPERQDISVERGESKTIDVRGRVVREQAQNHAALLFRAAPLSLGVEVEPSGTDVKLFAGDAWLQSRLGRLANAVPQLRDEGRSDDVP